MQDKLRGSARNAFAVRHVIERPLQLGMLLDVLADFLETFASGLQTLLELRLGFYLGLPKRHLHATVRVDLAFAGSLDR